MSAAARVAGNLLLAAGCLLLAVGHAATAIRAGAWLLGGLLVAEDVLLAACFATRLPSRVGVAPPRDWFAAAACVGLPLLIRPVVPPPVLAVVGAVLQVGGAALAVWATASLGRRLGVLPAYRGVATGGAYRVVRHPMYAAYTLAYVGTLAGAPSVANALVLASAAGLLAWRARREERVLARDVAYAAYAAGVPWRFVPGVR